MQNYFDAYLNLANAAGVVIDWDDTQEMFEYILPVFQQFESKLCVHSDSTEMPLELAGVVKYSFNLFINQYLLQHGLLV